MPRRSPAHAVLQPLLVVIALACSSCNERAAPAASDPAPGQAAASSGAAPGRHHEGDSRIHLLTYSFLQGHAEGVPCEPTDTPPLSSATELKRQLLASGDAALLILSGDTTTQSLTVPRNRAGLVSAAARAEVIMEALGAADVDAFVPGPGDLVNGVVPLLDMAARYGVTVLATNLTVEGRDDVLPYVIVEHDGLRLALLGAIPSQSVDGRDYGKEDGVEIEKPPAAIRPTARQIMRQGLADAVVLISNLPSKLNQNLCSAEELHFIIGSSEAQPADLIVQRDSTSMLNMRHMGRELAQTTIHVVDGDWNLIDLSPLYVLPDQIQEERENLAGYEQAFGTTDVEAIAHRVLPGREHEFLDKYTLMIENIDFVEAYKNYAGSSIEHRPAVLPDPPADNAVDAILTRQGPAIEAALDSLGGNPAEFELATAGVLRPEDCVSCHEEQYTFWASTGHAGAHDLLVPAQRQRDASCLVCHAAGFGIRGGYNDPRLGAPFGGVSCVNCHSPYRPHIESRRLVVDSAYVRSDADLLGCVDCHSRRRSPDFDRDAMLAQVTCPPMRPDDPVIRQVREDVLTAVARQRELGTAVDRDTYCEGRALVGLGREDEGFDVLFDYASRNTNAPGIALELANDFDEHGRSGQALQILRDVLLLTPSDLVLNERYADLLVNATDERARDPEAAISHIGLVMPPDAGLDEGKALRLRLTLVDAYYAAGRVEEGRALLLGLANAVFDDPDILESLIRHGEL